MYIFHAAVKDLPNTKFIKACYTQQQKNNGLIKFN